MKRFIPIVILVVWSFNLYTQKSFTSRSGIYSWNYIFSAKDMPTVYYIDTISRDSFLIKGKYYRKFRDIYLRDSGFKTYTFSKYDTVEVLTYDFGLKVGDSFNFTVQKKSIKMVLMEKSLVTIENIYLIKQKFTTNQSQISNVELIESIGANTRWCHPMIWYSSLFIYGEAGYHQFCVKDSNSISIFRDCPIGLSINNKKIEKLNLHPIPSSNFIHFDNSSPKSFFIYDVMGKQITKGECIEKIDISTLTKGIYFLHLYIKDVNHHLKFLKN